MAYLADQIFPLPFRHLSIVAIYLVTIELLISEFNV